MIGHLVRLATGIDLPKASADRACGSARLATSSSCRPTTPCSLPGPGSTSSPATTPPRSPNVDSATDEITVTTRADR